MRECRTIQRCFSPGACSFRKSDIVDQFSKYTSDGKVRATLQLLSQNSFSFRAIPLALSSPISLTDPSKGSVWDAVLKKHPDPQPISASHVLLPDTPSPSHDPHPVFFNRMDGDLIHRTVFKMAGAAGPSGLDVSCWKKLCSSFGRDSDELCSVVASVARKLCTSYVYVDPRGISSLVACRLIALDKNPGIKDQLE